MDELLVSLREDLIRKCGQPMIYPKDCYFLSEEIKRTTNRSVSTTTVKRFFRIIHHNHSTSRYVLDTFSIYLGFDSWNDYLNCLDKEKHIHKKLNSWDLLRKRVNPVTRMSLNSIKLKIGYNKKKFIHRPFANRIFSAFYRSDKTITALVAPQGYGKSSIIVQLIDSFFLGGQAVSPQDIICLIDGDLFINIISNNKGVELLEQFIEFDLNKSLLRYFGDEHKSVEGHVVIIIDDVDEIYYQDDKFHDFAGNLMKMVMAYAGKGWFKLLISFKPENLKVFSFFIEKYTSLKSQWFGMPFSADNNENINIPLFNEEEVRDIMKLNNFLLPIETLHYFHYDMIRAIKYPYLLFSLIDLNKHNVLVSELELIEDYVRGRIYSGAYGNEKQEIILSFLKLCGYGELSGSVRKKSLPLENQNRIAYEELVSYGIICETQMQEDYMYKSIYCRFLNKDLFNYITAQHWISNYGITLRLFKKLNAHYQYNLHLKLSIYNYLIKAAIKEGNLEFLKQVHRYFEGNLIPGSEVRDKINYSHYKELALTICLELRNHREHRDEMMRFFATTPLGRSLFYESNFDFDSLVLYSADNYKYYLENISELGSVIYANFMNFMKGFLSGNDSICHSVYEMNAQVDRTGFKDPVLAGLSDAVGIIYQSCILKYARLITIEEIIQTSRNLKASALHQGTKMPVYEFTVLFSLDYTDRFEDIIKLVKHIHSSYDLSGLDYFVFYQYHLLCYARALLHAGHTQEARQFYRRFELTEVPPLMKYYMLVKKYFIDIEFLLSEGNCSGAIALIENIRNISRVLQFRYFFARADKLRNLMRRSQAKVHQINSD
jgi:hypothetical protein